MTNLAWAILSVILIHLALAEARFIWTGTPMTVNSTCSGRRLSCKSGTVGCFSTLVSRCCTRCTSSLCGGCTSSNVCASNGCTSIALIIGLSVFGFIILLAIISVVLKNLRGSSYSSGSSAVVITTASPPPQETVIIQQVAPPPQQQYMPDTYVSEQATAVQYTYNQPVVSYPAAQYGAPQTTTTVETTRHDVY